MKNDEWFSSLLRPGLESRAVAALSAAGEAAPRDSSSGNGRSTRERLKATLRRQQEALSPRVLRRTLTELQAIIDPQVSEVGVGAGPKGSPAGMARPRRSSAATAGCS